MLAVRISKEMEERLEFWAKKKDRSKSYLVKKALAKFLENEEEYAIALKALESFEKSGRRTTSFEEVMRENDLL